MTWGRLRVTISKLSRIVLLNDVNLMLAKDTGLAMDAVAKTYRYLDEEELAKQKKSTKDAAAKK
jgi:type IV pilus assembly protein PilO